MTEPYEIVRTVRIDAPVDRVFGLLTDPVLLRSGLVYTWDWENEPMGVDTTVESVLEPDGDGTVVRLRHTGFPQPDWVDSHARGWDHVLPRWATRPGGSSSRPSPADAARSVSSPASCR